MKNHRDTSSRPHKNALARFSDRIARSIFGPNTALSPAGSRSDVLTECND